MNIKIKVGLKIKALRKQNELTQERLSEMTNINRTYISDVERGLRNISIINLEKIAIAFRIELYELLMF